jgi:predicted small lipoprotein YifL
VRGATLILAAALLLLAACGQKGPLYLPDKQAAVVTSAPAPAPAAPAPAAPKKATDKDQDGDATPPQ